ncbi:MAG: hypothetical protein DMF60_19470 [Acidobacteria bacterium]|nr:MAG: hypothetical protein DMF60_19470 [Acidobacteriota bacterium]
MANPATANPSYLGTIKGEFTVDQNGSAVYSIPIQVPPGTARMQPELSFVYHSALINGLMGVGWSLQGLSAIKRTGATPAQVGVRSGVRYNAKDRFALDGQRLMAVEGDYGSPATVYHTEIQSWRKITASFADDTDGPSAFLVLTKDGHSYEYGTSPDAQIRVAPDQRVVRVWALKKITDLHGNFLTFAYEQDPLTGAYYPSRVDYTGNANLQTQRAVVFSYEDRDDVEPHYEGGCAVHNTRRLKQVRTLVDGNLVLAYSLAYQPAKATGRSQLLSITLSDAEGRALKPTQFDWHDLDDVRFGEADPLPDSDVPTGGTIIPLDVNGDGFRDLIVAYPDNQNLALKLLLAKTDGTGFLPPTLLPPTGLLFTADGLLPLDVDGDGCSDLVYAVNNNEQLGLTLFTATKESDEWRLKQGKTNGAGPDNLPWGGQIVPMDIDGDGRIDLVYATNDSGNLRLQVLASNGSGFELKSETSTPLLYDQNARLLALDFNADGMTDLVYAYNDNGNLGLRYFLSNGTRLELRDDSPLPAGTTLPFGGALMVHSVKEDGNEDLVYACVDNSGNLVLYTLLNTGTGFQLSSANPPPTGLIYSGNILPVVARGPGLTDLVVAAPDANAQNTIFHLLHSTGSGFILPEGAEAMTTSLPWGGQILPLDLRGTGKTDLLHIGTSDGTNMRFTPLRAPSAVPDRVKRITNGLGGQVEITYKPITNPSVYSKDDELQTGHVDPQGIFNGRVSGASWPLMQGSNLASGTRGATYTTASRQFAEYVVCDHAVHDGRGNVYQYKHTYTGARIDMTGHGWLGFASKQTVDADLGITTIEEFEQVFPLTYSLKASRMLRSSDQSLMRRVTHQYTKLNGNSGVYRIQLRNLTTEGFTFGTLDRTTMVAQEYDEHDNVKKTITSADEARPLYVSLAYDDSDPARWRFGRENQRTVTADAEGGQILTREKFVNDPNTGMRLETHLWEDQHERWLVTKHAYDPFGNQTVVTDATGAITRTDYDETYHTFAACKTLPANEANLALVLRSEYDPRFGIERTHTDANSVQWFQTADGLGRVIEARGPDPEMNLVTLTKHGSGQDESGFYVETQRLVEWGGDDWRWERAYYDGMEREYRTAAIGPDGTSQIVVDRALNSKGQVLEESLPYFAGDAPKKISRTYDAAGRVVHEEQPVDGEGTRVIRTDYPHVDREVRTEAVGTPLERTTIKAYINQGDKRCLTQSTDGNGAVTSYDYDALGRLSSATDPNSIVTTTRYDSLNRRIDVSVANAEKTFLREQVNYDDPTRTVLARTNMANEIVFRHDARSRLIERIVHTLGGEPAHTHYRYDIGGGRLAMDRLAQVLMPEEISYAYTYDAHGNTTNHGVTLLGQAYAISKSYTPAGQVERLVYPDGAVLTNRHNLCGLIDEIEMAEQESLSAPQRFARFEQFTPFGKAQKVSYGNAVTEEAGYNRLGQIQSQTVTGADGASLADTSFHWDAMHALTRIEDRVDPTQTQTFAYDLAGRLTQAIRNPESATAQRIKNDFVYDHAGNLTSKDGVIYTYEGHHVIRGERDGAAVFTADYDDDGRMRNVTRRGKADLYNHDGQGRLVATNDATFTYDHTGQRLLKQTGDVTTCYISPHYEVTLFRTGGQATKYVPGPYGPLAQVTKPISGTGPRADQPAGIPAAGVSYFHRNHINSTTLHTDANGQVASKVEYHPFGEIRTLTGSDAFRHKFTGKELDYETGLYYFNARYYDPGIGRFITGDDRLGGAFGAPDALNRYAYVLNNPVTGIDLDGHFRWDIFADIMIDIAAVALIATATVMTGGAAAAVVGLAGSALMGAGVEGSRYSATHSGGDLSWGRWGREVGIGAATGAISGGPTGAAFKATASVAMRFGWSMASRVVVTGIVGGLVGMGTQVANQAIHNRIDHKAWNEGWQSSLEYGAAKGFVTGMVGGYVGSDAGKAWVRSFGVTPARALMAGGGAISATAAVGVIWDKGKSEEHPNYTRSMIKSLSPQALPSHPEPHTAAQFVGLS